MASSSQIGNGIKHSNATQVSIGLALADGIFVVRISDIGCGLVAGAPMSPHIARQVVGFFDARPAPGRKDTFSERERQIFGLLATGQLCKEIAEKLDLTFETVRSYVKRIHESSTSIHTPMR